jgi:hypothetical protein
MSLFPYRKNQGSFLQRLSDVFLVGGDCESDAELADISI